MRIHDIGPRTEVDHAAPKSGSWVEDYGPRGFVARDRPFIDDPPAHRHDWEAHSRWGSRPYREFDRDLARGLATAKGFVRVVWTRIREAVRGAV